MQEEHFTLSSFAIDQRRMGTGSEHVIMHKLDFPSTGLIHLQIEFCVTRIRELFGDDSLHLS